MPKKDDNGRRQLIDRTRCYQMYRNGKKISTICNALNRSRSFVKKWKNSNIYSIRKKCKRSPKFKLNHGRICLLKCYKT